MKFTILFSTLFLCQFVFSQNQITSVKQDQQVVEKQLSSDEQKSKPSQVVKTNQEWTLESLDKYILALEVKKNWVKNNPEENQKAIESGWFEKIDTSINNARLKREAILQKQN